MDSVVHHNPSQSTLTPVSSSHRRSRENETPAQRQKREKAAERQRRKRERDRHVNNLNVAMSYPQPTDPQPPPQPHAPQSLPQTFTGEELSPEELARKEKLKAGARERQRKHRSLVKQRKMRDLGLDMTSEVLQGMEDVQFRVNGQNEYHQVLPHEIPHPHSMDPQDPSFPQPPLTGGQSFASTLLLSFSCAPLLKQHILRTLSLTNEDLASLEPVIAGAFDQWYHQRRMHDSMGGPSGAPFPDMNDPSANAFGDQSPPHASEFRARFHRSLVAPSPFRNFNPGDSATSTPTSTPGSGPPSDPIDPHLSGVVLGTGDSRPKAAIDPDFGQAKGEAEGVVGKLERQ
ncbi:hypothetical protein BU15DRAFT_72948 [Melanogaster broomeanus]|nr:hypothetical protein BU15DRAFT_72948 [Melanogaster broomeanus]